MRKLRVVAPNYRWARDEMREMFPELGPLDWRYCSSPRDLMGLSEQATIVVFPGGRNDELTFRLLLATRALVVFA